MQIRCDELLFKKIPINFLDLDLSVLDYSREKKTYIGNTFKSYDVGHFKIMIDILRERVKFHILPDLMNITDILSPGVDIHRDLWSTALNFYLKGSGDRTVFYQKFDTEKKINNYSYNELNLQNLKEDSSFVAEQGDCWLINTTRHHKVQMSRIDDCRTILRLAWHRRSFDEVYQSIELL